MEPKKITLKTRLILYDKGRILLLKQTKPNGGNYTLVGGNVESREFAKEALIRETFEEAGIIVKKKHLQLVHVLHKIKRDEHRVTLYFKAHKWKGELEAKEKTKFKKVEWFSLNNLPREMTETVRHVFQNYRKGRMYSEFDQK